MSKELEEKLAQIRECPKSCVDGMIEIRLNPGQMRKAACPVLNPDCRYGIWMERALDRYVTRFMSGIGVPLRHLEKFERARQTEASAEIVKWQTQGFLIFTGSSGSGKSFGAAMAVHQYLKSLVSNHFDRLTWSAVDRAGSTVVWSTAVDISDDRQTAARAKQERLVVIDDLGGETDTPLGRAALGGVILRRHDMKLPTVITTPLTMLDIDIRYGGRVADRLTEDIGHGGMIIECGSVSMRGSAVFLAAGKS